MSRAQDIDGVTVEELVALADGELPIDRVADVEARVAESPRAAAALRAQQRALAATRTFAPPASARLPAALRPPRPPSALLCGRRSPRPAASWRWRSSIGLALNRPEGTLAAAVDISGRRALEPPPSPDARPRSAAALVRRRHVPGLAARVLVARDRRPPRQRRRPHDRHRLLPAHAPPHRLHGARRAPASSRRRRAVASFATGVTIQLYHDGPRTVAVFERGGRTCVLAGVVHRDSTLVKLAAWKHSP